MKEIEWSSCPNPKAMLEFLGNRISDRHLKQFSVTCYEHIQEFLTEEAKAAVKAFAADIDNQIDSEALLNAVELLESEMFDPSSSGTIGGILNSMFKFFKPAL